METLTELVDIKKRSPQVGEKHFEFAQDKRKIKLEKELMRNDIFIQLY